MPDELQPILSENDFGGWADFYASGPVYGHFKDELYPLFAQALRQLPARARVLDIGAGPGNLTLEYGKLHPAHPLKWILIDASREMLKIARERLASQDLATQVRSFNQDGWDDGLTAAGPLAAIVSTNALFNLRPERLDGFYAACAQMLAPGGWLLTQQSFGWSHLENPQADKGFPAAAQRLLGAFFPGQPAMDASVQTVRETEKRAALARKDAAIAAAQATGAKMVLDQSGYHFLTVEEHVASLRKAGFQAGELWRKREFAVLLALKP